MAKRNGIVAKEPVLFVGKLVFDRKQMNTFFRDMNGVLHDLLKISFSSREFNSEDGQLTLPKPEIIKEDGSIEETGDVLLYSYINGNENDIVIISSIYNIKLSHVDKQLRMGTDDIDAIRKRIGVRNNKKRYLVINDDGAGNYYFYLKGKDKNGNVGVKITGDGAKNGNFKFELNGKCLLKQVDEKGGLISKIFLDNTKENEKTVIEDKFINKIELNKDGVILETATLRLGKDETVAKIMKDLIAEIRAMSQGTAAGGPTISPPFNDAKFAAIVSRISKFMEKQ